MNHNCKISFSYTKIEWGDIIFFSRFGAFEELKRFNVDENGNLTPFKRMLCGLGESNNIRESLQRKFHIKYWMATYLIMQ